MFAPRSDVSLMRPLARFLQEVPVLPAARHWLCGALADARRVNQCQSTRESPGWIVQICLGVSASGQLPFVPCVWFADSCRD